MQLRVAIARGGFGKVEGIFAEVVGDNVDVSRHVPILFHEAVVGVNFDALVVRLLPVRCAPQASDVHDQRDREVCACLDVQHLVARPGPLMGVLLISSSVVNVHRHFRRAAPAPAIHPGALAKLVHPIVSPREHVAVRRERQQMERSGYHFDHPLQGLVAPEDENGAGGAQVVLGGAPLWGLRRQTRGFEAFARVGAEPRAAKLLDTVRSACVHLARRGEEDRVFGAKGKLHPADALDHDALLVGRHRHDSRREVDVHRRPRAELALVVSAPEVRVPLCVDSSRVERPCCHLDEGGGARCWIHELGICREVALGVVGWVRGQSVRWHVRR
mmetsp:Transcript_8497/g.21084  ORF Transcript_8497/g.21084 Transcript_8497/m.21084 type:complete len:330 (-) Transcript_8497:1917-2906(-)